MSNAQGESESVSGSLYSWGAGWVEYAQQQITSFLGAEDLEVVDPDGDEAHSGADLVNPDDERQKFWKNMQDYIGHDITSLISVPVWIMEPHTVLQRMSEIMEYTELLDQADQCDDEFKRLAIVLAFAVTPYGAIERPWKPFNPILGETFELHCGNNVQFLAEQVSHHPPIGAAHAENPHFVYDIVSAPRSKFLGNSVEVYPEGRSRISLKSTGDEYYLKPPTAKACNIVIGRTWIDNYGPLSVTHVVTGNKAEVVFTPCGWFGQGRYEFSGYVTEASSGLRKYKIYGKWNSYCDAVAVNDIGSIPEESGKPIRLWSCKEKPKDDYYGRTDFIVAADKCLDMGSQFFTVFDIEGSYEPLLSDSRRRPDRSALAIEESGEAGQWKHQLEEMQRREQRERENRGDEWKPRWFQKTPAGSTGGIVHAGEYDFDAVPNWTWRGAYDTSNRKKVVDEEAVIGKAFKPWQYPELHQGQAQ